MKVKSYYLIKNILLVTLISFFLNSCEKEVVKDEPQGEPKPNSVQNFSDLETGTDDSDSEKILFWESESSNDYRKDGNYIYEFSKSNVQLNVFEFKQTDDFVYGYNRKSNLYIALPLWNEFQLASTYTRSSSDDSWTTTGNRIFTKKEKAVQWKMLTLVIKNFDVKYGDDQSYKGTMSSDLVERHVAVAKQIPAAMSEWTNGQAKASMDVKVIDDAITSLSAYGTGYWPSPSSTESILDKYAPKGKYSSITIAVDMGTIPKTWGGLGYYPGADYANGAIYSVMSFDEVSGFIHEWLHGAGGWYREKGFDVPDPHDNSQFGHTDTTDGTWDFWYKDLMNARINRNDAAVGYSNPVWNYPGPSVEL